MLTGFPALVGAQSSTAFVIYLDQYYKGSEPRLNVRTGAIGQREVGLAGKAGATEEHAYLREWEPRSVQGDPRSIANDHEPTVPVTARAMRRQAARVGAPRQKVVPKGSVLRQVRAGAPHSVAFVFHVREFGVLSPSATTRCARLH
jgi:hypothetical protein